MNIQIEITEKELRELVLAKLQFLMGELTLEAKDITIQVKSKQNYKSEWEEAAFRAAVNKTI